MAWPNRSSFFPVGALLPATFKTYLTDFYDQTVALLGSAGTPAAARAALGIGLMSRVKGLRGNVNATTPLTKFDLSADEVVLLDANGATYRDTNTGTLTVDLGLVGPAANGRDQSAAFAANSWVHLYRIWNGTTRALLASLSATAPTLPSGYTHWAYATAIRWNGSSNIVKCYVDGAYVEYDAPPALVAAGVATTMTAINCASAVPPVSRRAVFNYKLIVLSSSPFAYQISSRVTGSTASGTDVTRTRVQVGGQYAEGSAAVVSQLNASQSIDYKINAAPDTAGGAYIDILGYFVHNGDV